MASTASSEWLVGIDSGGTFTDLFAIHPPSGEIVTAKVPSTPSRPVDAVAACASTAARSGPIGRLVHGTTVATNALLERRGGRLCLLTTAGFEDVARIQRINRRYAFDLTWRKPEALVRRRHVIGVVERIGPDGAVLQHLSEGEIERVASVVADLVERDEIDAVAICLLFSYVTDRHERALEDALRAALPTAPVSLSSAVSPIWREYERTSTTLADAYVRPVMTSYLRSIERDLGSLPVVVLKSNGGTAAPASVLPRPVATVLSGLAGGIVGGAHFAAAAGMSRCITIDIGGTSTDVGLVHDGRPGSQPEFEIEWGLPVVTPAVDVHAVGAGGGSIAHVDPGGLLQVGPRSAGADPGPAAYRRGGLEPTVTDADVVLGRLAPGSFLGGRLPLDAEAADAAVAGVGRASGLDTRAAALAIVAIANENVANAIRLLTIDRGVDPRGYALVAFGGAGPLHVCGVARALGITTVLVPPMPGLCSAYGAAIAPLRVDRAWTVGGRSDSLVAAALAERVEAVTADATAELRRDGHDGRVEVAAKLSCRYHLQNYEHDVVIDNPAGPDFLARIEGGFHALHRAAYGYAFDGEPVEIVHGRVTAVGERSDDVRLPDPPAAAERVSRSVVEDDGEARVATVLGRGLLGRVVEGPLVIEEEASTTYVPSGWRATDGPLGSMVLQEGTR
jgi:N-methylhydantoinase A